MFQTLNRSRSYHLEITEVLIYTNQQLAKSSARQKQQNFHFFPCKMVCLSVVLNYLPICVRVLLPLVCITCFQLHQSHSKIKKIASKIPRSKLFILENYRKPDNLAKWNCLIPRCPNSGNLEIINKNVIHLKMSMKKNKLNSVNQLKMGQKNKTQKD